MAKKNVTMEQITEQTDKDTNIIVISFEDKKIEDIKTKLEREENIFFLKAVTNPNNTTDVDIILEKIVNMIRGTTNYSHIFDGMKNTFFSYKMLP